MFKVKQDQPASGTSIAEPSIKTLLDPLMCSAQTQTSAPVMTSSDLASETKSTGMPHFDSPLPRTLKTALGPDEIVVRVGNSTFHTTTGTLVKSPFFMDYFRSIGDETSITKKEWFVDADGDMFHHILAFLRSGQMPLLWTKDQGFDYAAYARLNCQALLFGCNELVDWISAKKFRSIIQESLSYEMIEVDSSSLRDDMLEMESDPDYSRRVIATEHFNRYEFRCPRGIPVHLSRGHCGKQCENKAGNNDAAFKVPIPITRIYFELCEIEIDL